MRKITKLAAVLCAVSMAAAMGFTSLADNETAESMLDEGLGLVRMDGTVVSVEDGRLTMNRRIGDGMEEIVVTLSDDTRILEGVNGYPVPGENLEAGEAVRVYVGQAMTLSLPPITNGALVITDVPADAGFPTYTTVTSLVQSGTNGEYTLTASDGGTYTISSETTILPYLTRNIVTVSDLTAGTAILLWSGDGSAAERIVIFQGENGYGSGTGEADANLSGWKETEEGWYFYENGQLKTGWLMDGGDWYYLNPETGLMATGFVTVGGRTYFLKEDGRMLTKAAVFEPDASGALYIKN